MEFNWLKRFNRNQKYGKKAVAIFLSGKSLFYCYNYDWDLEVISTILIL
jgi:hypothetical protein